MYTSRVPLRWNGADVLTSGDRREHRSGRYQDDREARHTIRRTFRNKISNSKRPLEERWTCYVRPDRSR